MAYITKTVSFLCILPPLTEIQPGLSALLWTGSPSGKKVFSQIIISERRFKIRNLLNRNIVENMSLLILFDNDEQLEQENKVSKIACN